MTWEWEPLIWIRQDPRSARRRVSRIPPECWEECTTVSRTAASDRRSWRNLLNKREFVYGTVLPMNIIPHRCRPICLRSENILGNLRASALYIGETPATIWRIL